MNVAILVTSFTCQDCDTTSVSRAIVEMHTMFGRSGLYFPQDVRQPQRSPIGVGGMKTIVGVVML